jgi:hypothetical protein
MRRYDSVDTATSSTIERNVDRNVPVRQAARAAQSIALTRAACASSYPLANSPE